MLYSSQKHVIISQGSQVAVLLTKAGNVPSHAPFREGSHTASKP